jgi:hypothetical protein
MDKAPDGRSLKSNHLSIQLLTSPLRGSVMNFSALAAAGEARWGCWRIGCGKFLRCAGVMQTSGGRPHCRQFDQVQGPMFRGAKNCATHSPGLEIFMICSGFSTSNPPYASANS